MPVLAALPAAVRTLFTSRSWHTLRPLGAVHRKQTGSHRPLAPPRWRAVLPCCAWLRSPTALTLQTPLFAASRPRPGSRYGVKYQPGAGGLHGPARGHRRRHRQAGEAGEAEGDSKAGPTASCAEQHKNLRVALPPLPARRYTSWSRSTSPPTTPTSATSSRRAPPRAVEMSQPTPPTVPLTAQPPPLTFSSPPCFPCILAAAGLQRVSDLQERPG